MQLNVIVLLSEDNKTIFNFHNISRYDMILALKIFNIHTNKYDFRKCGKSDNNVIKTLCRHAIKITWLTISCGHV